MALLTSRTPIARLDRVDKNKKKPKRISNSKSNSNHIQAPTFENGVRVHGASNPDGLTKSQRMPPPPNYKCRLCNKRGHYIYDCTQFQPDAKLGFVKATTEDGTPKPATAPSTKEYKKIYAYKPGKHKAVNSTDGKPTADAEESSKDNE